MFDTPPQSRQPLAARMVDFALACGDSIERNVLIEGVLPPVVRGYRLGQQQRDDRPHMGGSDAENRAHFAAFLALLRRHLPADGKDDFDGRVARSVAPYLTRRLVPFPHRAVLETLWAYGPLAENALWQKFEPDIRARASESLFDVGHYFDSAHERMRTLPDNYLWITAQNALLASRLVGTEPGDLTPLADSDRHHAAAQAGRSALRTLLEKLHAEPWFDDKPPGVVVDQYAWETVAAAVRLCREYRWEEDLERLAPVARRYLRVLRLLAREDGYAICWGRSQGIISYGTTIYAVLALSSLLFERGELDRDELLHDLDIAARAFATLQREWFDGDGLTTMHRHGRQPYSYRGPHRLVGSTFGMLVKILQAAQELEELDLLVTERRLASSEDRFRVNAAYGDASRAGHDASGPDCSEAVGGVSVAVPGRDGRVETSHWEAFREPHVAPNGRRYGLWIARSGPWHVTLPLVGSNTSFEPGHSSNYLPAPLVPFLLDVPTQQSGPYGTEFVELSDGSVWSAADGCDEVEFDGQRLTFRWQRFLNVRSLELADDVAQLSIAYELHGHELRREHSFSSDRDDIEHRYSLLAIALGRHEALGERRHRFRSLDEELESPADRTDSELELLVDGELRRLSVENTLDLPAGRSFLGPLPWTVALHLPTSTSQTRMSLTLHRGPAVVL